MVSPPAAFTSSWILARRRIARQCLQHPLFLDALQTPLQKIDLQGLLADLALQLSDAAFSPALLAVARKDVAWPGAELPPPALQDIGVDLQRPRRLSDGTPCSSRRTAASLNSFVNILLDNPMTQF
jgi:hypothetical protein